MGEREREREKMKKIGGAFLSNKKKVWLGVKDVNELSNDGMANNINGQHVEKKEKKLDVQHSVLFCCCCCCYDRRFSFYLFFFSFPRSANKTRQARLLSESEVMMVAATTTTTVVVVEKWMGIEGGDPLC